MKIIDMTGREQKILHGYESLSKRHSRPEEDDDFEYKSRTKDKQKLFDMPELLHNLDLLVNMTEEKIIESDRK
jgi:tuftelin-interacting protein 11